MLDLFLVTKAAEKGLWSTLQSFVTDEANKVPFTVAGVFLFAAAYFVGAAVTRVSGDFFNDDDILLPHVRLPTEDNIRTDVYCDPEVVHSSVMNTTRLGMLCDKVKANQKEESEKARTSIQQTFYLEEGALLQEGGDKTDRLNQLHSQILVLRGAAFDGLITLMLCAFGWCGQPGRWRVCWPLPIALLGVGGYVLFKHLVDHHLDDPPFMEVACIVLGLAGLIMLKKGAPERTTFPIGIVASLLFSAIAYFGWWWSEVLYDREVLYSFYAQSNNLLHLAK